MDLEVNPHPDRASGRSLPADALPVAERRGWELRLLQDVRMAVAGMTELNEVLRTIVDHVADAFGYNQVGLYLLRGEMLVLQEQHGFDHVLKTIPSDQGVIGRAMRTGMSQFVPDVSKDDDFVAMLPDVRSEICCPFFSDGRLAGVLNVESRGDRVLTGDDLGLIEQIASFLDLAMRYDRLSTNVRSSEGQLKLVLEAARMGTWEQDWPTETTRLSSQMAEMFGLDPTLEEVLTERIEQLIFREDLDYVRSAMTTGLAFKDDLELEFRIVLPSSVIRWIHIKGQVTRRAVTGEPIQMIGIATDVTGRKRLEEERLRLLHLESARAHAEDAQRRITDTLERLSAGFVAIDTRRWTITFVNSEAARLLAQTRGDLLGRSVEEAFAEFGGTPFESRLRVSAALQTAEKFEVELAASQMTLEVHVSPAPGGLSLYLQDVTEGREAERERERIEARFRSLVQYASDIILILEHDGVVRYISPAIERVLGFPAAEFLGTNNVFRVHPQDAKRLRRAFIRVAKTAGVSTPVVLRFQHCSGTYRWLEVTATNLFHDPTVEGIVANCRDVTERHEAEFNLWFLAETSAVLGASLDLGETLDALVRLLVMNVTECCIVDVLDEAGAATDSVVGHRHRDQELLLQEYRERYPLDVEADDGPGFVARTGWPLLYETLDDAVVGRMTGGTEERRMLAAFELRSAMVVTLNARGVRLGVLTLASTRPGRFGEQDLGLVEEIARRAALAIDNAKLYRAATAAIANRDTFLSVAAHELRTPITAITGFATLLQREIADRNDRPRVERYVDRIGTAAMRLAGLVTDMLDVSRTQLGQIPLRVAVIDLAGLVHQIASRISEPLVDSPHVLTVTLPPGECHFEGDEDRLEQVISNVIENAIKYSPDGGEITITLDAHEVGYHLRVSDTGMGLPRSALESIFLPFGRAENAMASNLPGLGIGLYIARNIVERHGGKIWAESAGENLGLTMHLQLPRRQSTEEAFTSPVSA